MRPLLALCAVAWWLGRRVQAGIADGFVRVLNAHDDQLVDLL